MDEKQLNFVCLIEIDCVKRTIIRGVLTPQTFDSLVKNFLKTPPKCTNTEAVNQ